MKRLLAVLLTALMLLSCIPAVGYAAENPGESKVPETKTVTMYTSQRLASSDNDELFAGFVDQVMYGYEMATFGTAARAHLNTAEQAIYDALKPKIQAVARNGGSTVFSFPAISGLKTTWTNTELGVASIDDYNLVINAFSQQFSLDAIVTAMLSDFPFDLYWFDKTVFNSMGLTYQIELSGWDTTSSASITDMTFSFVVVDDYAVGKNAVSTDVSLITAARNNAARVVADNAGKSDYEKLLAYKNYICNAVSYNNDAARDDYSGGYGDPWQLIHVFDGNTATNVVCEGYSKAFMYLCDLSSFAADTVCCTVTGWMDGGGHMWNIVSLAGGNYLVDVTNSDSGTWGQDGSLFMAGGSGSAAGGYTVSQIRYVYDSQTKSLWGTGADSVLTLSGQKYSGGTQESTAVESGYCGDNVIWTMYEDGTLVISGSGDMWEFVISESQTEVERKAPWECYANSIAVVKVQAGVTSIGAGAFLQTEYGILNTVQLPEGITKIGNYAFMNARIEEIDLPDSLTEIGSSAFYNCDSLAEIVIPANVRTIGQDAFFDCAALTCAVLPEGLTRIEDFMFDQCTSLTSVNIPSSVTSIGDRAFCMTKLSSVVLPAGLRSIESGAFGQCQLTALVLPDGLQSIGQQAFTGNEFTSIVIPNSVTDLEGGGYGLFIGCEKLEKVVLPESMTYIGEDIFFNCHSLTQVNIPQRVTRIENRAFTGCFSLPAIALPENLTYIGELAFMRCDSLEEIVIPDTVTAIGLKAFDSCGALKFVKLPEGLEKLEVATFNMCIALEEVTIPESVTQIGEGAFYDCQNLKKVTFCGNAPVFDGSDIFHDVTTEISYPGNDATWTADVKRQYGGSLTWMPIALRDGWVLENGKWYYYEENEKQTGWLSDQGKWYYMDASGAMQTGWVKSGNYWYYMDTKGVMQTGWVGIGGKWYYMNQNGVMMTGWVKDGGNWYYMSSGGVMQTGWQTVNGYKYYFTSGGKMATGATKIGSTTYLFNSGGTLGKGWVQSGGKWYYANSSGVAQTGWVSAGGKWYYMDANGIMQTGLKQIGGKYYYFTSGGVMTTGWQTVNGTRHRFDSKGAAVSGWYQESGRWYFLKNTGAATTGWMQDGGYWYFMDKSTGVMKTGWATDGGYWYYMNKSGVMQTGWVQDGSYWYYMNKSGVMVTGTQVINGKTYKFNSSGVWIG